MLMDDTLCEYCEPNDADDFIVEGAVRPCCFGSPELPWHLGPREGCFDFAQRIGCGQMNQDLYFRKRWNAKMAACRKKGSLQKPHWGHIPGIHLVQCHAHGFDNDSHFLVILRISSYIVFPHCFWSWFPCISIWYNFAQAGKLEAPYDL